MGHSTGANKDNNLIGRVPLGYRYSLNDIRVFNLNWDGLYDNIKIDEVFHTLNIERSLNREANPYDNAVSEVTDKILKIEFI